MPTTTPDGVLLVDKSAGATSHDAVVRARRATGEPRIGHTGTLDPFATGLLVLLVGRATRLLPHLPDRPKEYLATIRFGAATDTDDADGAAVATAPPPGEAAVRAALPRFVGTFAQVPPAYSAKRVAGTRAYALARAGAAPVLPAVPVRVDAFTLLAWRGGDAEVEADVHVVCAGGTYIRALARDLATAVGSAGHLVALRRTRTNGFAVRDAAAADALVAGAPVPLRPALDLLDGVPRQTVDAPDALRLRRGIAVAATTAGDHAALVDAAGVLVAFAERRGDLWQPRVVMRDG
jgi:tRNA pseudouridine55 synthase